MKENVVCLFLLIFVASFTAMAQTTLKIGDQAPHFTSKDQDGKNISLRDLKGKKVVLYFYPKDQTPGCTKEACNLRDNIDALKAAGYVVLGVSPDDEASHRAFIEKYSLPFTLVADIDKSIHQKYGTWVEKEKEGKKYWGTARKTFLIDEKGVISDIIENVDTENHAFQILKS